MYREQYGEDVTWSYGVEGWGRIKAISEYRRKTILIKKFDLSIQKQNFESQRILFITFL